MRTTFSHQALRTARNNRGLSRERLALAIDRSYNTVAEYEQGTSTPPLRVLFAIAETLAIAPEELFEVAT